MKKRNEMRVHQEFDHGIVLNKRIEFLERRLDSLAYAAATAVAVSIKKHEARCHSPPSAESDNSPLSRVHAREEASDE